MEDLTESKKVTQGKNWVAWLKEGTFYVHGVVYMLVRISINVTMTMQPFFLEYVTEFKPTKAQPTPVQVAIVPLISYVFQLVFSIYLQRPMTQRLRNRFLPMLLAIVITLVGFVPLVFLNGDRSINWLVYVLAPFQGIGQVIMLNTATSLISDVIGNDTSSSAFVYGCYSLFDKFSNGIILFFLVSAYSKNVEALRWIMVVTPITTSILAYAFTWIGNRYFSDKMAKITGIQADK